MTMMDDWAQGLDQGGDDDQDAARSGGGDQRKIANQGDNDELRASESEVTANQDDEERKKKKKRDMLLIYGFGGVLGVFALAMLGMKFLGGGSGQQMAQAPVDPAGQVAMSSAPAASQDAPGGVVMPMAPAGNQMPVYGAGAPGHDGGQAGFPSDVQAQPIPGVNQGSLAPMAGAASEPVNAFGGVAPAVGQVQPASALPAPVMADQGVAAQVAATQAAPQEQAPQAPGADSAALMAEIDKLRSEVEGLKGQVKTLSSEIKAAKAAASRMERLARQQSQPQAAKPAATKDQAAAAAAKKDEAKRAEDRGPRSDFSIYAIADGRAWVKWTKGDGETYSVATGSALPDGTRVTKVDDVNGVVKTTTGDIAPPTRQR